MNKLIPFDKDQRKLAKYVVQIPVTEFVTLLEKKYIEMTPQLIIALLKRYQDMEGSNYKFIEEKPRLKRVK